MNNTVHYYNALTHKIEQEPIYGEKALRWTYNHPIGRLTLFLFIRRKIASLIYGKLMSRPASKKKISPFLQQFRLNTNEFTENPADFSSFDAFFTRALHHRARLLNPGEKTLIFPADGRHLAIQNLQNQKDIFVKNQPFPLDKFLGDPDLSDRCKDGSMLISRLCPTDYHRVHFPCAGTPSPVRCITGNYYSVNPIALKSRPGIFAENQRFITQIETTHFGSVWFIEIAATFVGSMIHTHPAHYPARKGEEKGWFRFGGSSTAILFEKSRITFSKTLLENSAKNLETYNLMGAAAGTAD